MKILHLEDNASDSLIIERGLQRQGFRADFVRARGREEFLAVLEEGGFDVVLVDNGLPRFDAREAIAASKALYPEIPVIVCSGAARDTDVSASLNAGASDYVLKDHLWQLAGALRRAASSSAGATPERLARQHAAMSRLVGVVQELSLARGIEAIIETVRHAARDLTGADGATFVLRDGNLCHYADEDAIAPLWKGKRFPLETCISGWAMLNGKSAVIPDIYQDPRIPIEAYRPTFVRSLVMVPIRPSAPLGAIGNYWADPHECTADQLMLLEALANTTAVAMENVRIYSELEKQVHARTLELEGANQELEAFTSAVSHDLRAPLRAVQAELDGIEEEAGCLERPGVERLRGHAQHMTQLIDDLLRLSRISRTGLEREPVDIAELANATLTRLRSGEPARQVELTIEPCPRISADLGLASVAIENLLSNAWKYSSKRELARIEVRSYLDRRGRRVFCIADNGAGFDASYADRLFKPFARLHDDHEFPGIGIGLATVQRILQRHGGEIWARSQPDAGAEFHFTFDETREPR